MSGSSDGAARVADADALALAVLDAEEAHAMRRSAGTADALDRARQALAAALHAPPPAARALVLLLGVAVELAYEPMALRDDPAFRAVVRLAGRALLGLDRDGDEHVEGTAAAVQLAAVVARQAGTASGVDLDL